MRLNKYGRNVSFKDELDDIIADALPKGEEVDSFLGSKEKDRMLDDIVDITQEHIDFNMDSRKITE